MPTISPRWDIKSLIEHYANIQVVSSANVRTHGGGTVKEYHSNCPWCGGHDRFITRPETGQFTCATRGCGKSGDGKDFLVWYMKMTEKQAIEELALEGVLFAKGQPEPKRGQYDPPSEKWQDTGKNFVERAARYLWGSSPKATEALAYLRSRGLDDATIRRKKYGCCPLQSNGQWYGADPAHGTLEHWGLKPEDVSEKIRERGTIRIPPGIVIPWFENDTLWKIAIKRYTEPKPHDYGEVAGSVSSLYNVDSIRPGQPCFITEAEFCADSIEQAAGDLVSVVATGGAPKGHNPYFIPSLSLPSCLPQAFDNDPPDSDGKQAGDAGAVYWLCLYDHCFRYRPIAAKDPNDMLRKYGRAYVRDWVLRALARWEELQATGTLARVS